MRRLLLLLITFAACAPGIRRPDSDQVVFTGTLTAGGFDQRGDRLTSATVRLVDATTGDELARNVTSSAGGYRLTLDLAAPRRVVFTASAEGFAPIAQAMTIGPSSEVTLSAALSPATPFECGDQACEAPFVDLRWVTPPMNAAGQAAVFHDELPVRVEVDERHSPLAVLGWVSVTGDHAGRFRLRVPRAAWPTLEDATPGTGRFEVRVARFDVTTARWSLLTPVPLVTEAGLALNEDAALGSADFTAGVVADIPAVTDGFYAVLGRADASLGCITSSLVAEGTPAVGASFAFPGFEPVVASGEAATFCAVGPVATTPAQVTGQYAGLLYSYGSVTSPSSAGACGGTCQRVPPIELVATAVQTPALCDFTGTLVDADGAPVANAAVVAMDETVPGNAVVAFCGELGTRCRFTAATGPDGSFRLVVPLATRVVLGARTSTGGFRGASDSFRSCPNMPMTMPLSYGERPLELDVAWNGATLTWTPALPAARVTVVDTAGDVTWEVVSARGLVQPVTFGVVPAGATQTVAPRAAPAPGDTAGVQVSGTDRAGITFSGIGAAGVP